MVSGTSVFFVHGCKVEGSFFARNAQVASLDLLLIYQIRKKIVFKQAIYFNRIQFICLMLCLSEGCVYKPQYIFDTMAHACQREDGFG